MYFSPWHLRQAVEIIHSGGIVAYPTEAVYGLGCDPMDLRAVERLIELKDRALSKGLILIAADFSQLLPFVKPLAGDRMRAVLESWPGPYTWLLPANDDTPAWITGASNKLAVRVTAHPIAADLCRACESPLVSTSANPGGLPPAKSGLMVRKYFGDRVDTIVHGKLGGMRRPTPIRDAVSGEVLRN